MIGGLNNSPNQLANGDLRAEARRNGFTISTLDNMFFQYDQYSDDTDSNVQCSYVLPTQQITYPNSFVSIMGHNIRSVKTNFDNFKEK